MVYSINDSNLPDYVKELNVFLKKQWVIIYNELLLSEGEEVALIVANEWLLDNKDKYSLVCKTLNSSDCSIKMVKKSIGGKEYVDVILADTSRDPQGDQLSESLLKKWERQINDEGLKISGDFDHVMYDELISKGYSPDKIISMLRIFKQGVAKGIKAIYDKGKLWLRTLIDPEYKELIASSNGVSIEAKLIVDDNGVAVDGELGGFTFARKTKQVNPNAIIVK